VLTYGTSLLGAGAVRHITIVRAPLLFDHLIDAHEERHRHFYAESLRGIEVDDEFDLGGLLNRTWRQNIDEKGRAILRPQPSTFVRLCRWRLLS
jgi:hypothetical protein